MAKLEKLNWQSVLIQDCETDLKIMTLESVKKLENYNTVNAKIVKKVNETVNLLESEVLKVMCLASLLTFASRMYIKWLLLLGTKPLANSVLAKMRSKGVEIPPKIVEKVNALPMKPVKVTGVSDYAYNKAVANGVYDKKYGEELQKRINELLDDSAKEDYSERYTLRASAERQIRAEYQEKQLTELAEQGIDLVWIDTHANCSLRCQKWQGKLYSISGKTGVIDGIGYQPLSNATDIYETTSKGITYKNGCLSGFNCRHKVKPYKTGNKPNYIPPKVIERQRIIEKRQRELERTVRKYESRALGWRKLDKQKYLHYKNLANKWKNDYIDFSKKNNVAYYPSRLDI